MDNPNVAIFFLVHRISQRVHKLGVLNQFHGSIFKVDLIDLYFILL